MCGIAGYAGLKSGNQALLKKMSDAQAHRGPDGEGYFTKNDFGLGHRRLAIIDRATGDQPMTNVEGNLTVIYNGEIYNFRQLRLELEGLGRQFKTQSDTEVILQAYAQWGPAGFDRLNGMFGLAIFDHRKNQLVLARDHFGIKPLYFINLGSAKKPEVLFASEIKALLASGAFDAKPNDRQIYRYLKFRVHEADAETFFAGVRKLLPGEYAIVDAKSGLKISRYSDLPDRLSQASTKHLAYSHDQTGIYKDKLTQAIRMRLVSEVPVGTCLSGGLDSSTIVLTINRLLAEHDSEARAVGAQQNTFSAVFPGSLNDEERYIDATLALCGDQVKSHKLRPTAQSLLADLKDFIRTQEEPTISTGPYAQYKVMQTARGQVTVLLDGQGADEMLAGYYPYYIVYLRQLRRQGRWLRLVLEILLSADVLWRFLRWRLYDRLRLRRSLSLSSLLATEFRQAHQQERFGVVGDNLKRRFIEDIFANSLPALLRYEDKNAMRFGLEGRVPFLDKEVLPYLFSLDDRAVIRGSWNKRILRDATKGLLPDAVRRRRNKIGFTTPEVEWFKALANDFYQILTSESFGRRPYFDQAAAVEAYKRFKAGRLATDTMTFWRLINVELWLREFIDRPAAKTAKAKPDLQPNTGKQLDIKVGRQTYRRYPLQTDIVRAGENLKMLITKRLAKFFKAAPGVADRPWYLFVSEKIVAISQGRAYFIWDVKAGIWARLLSKFVSRTPYGIGLGSPWTMQLAIELAGLPRLLLAAAAGAAGKIIGRRGVFYNLVGSDVRAIDGPTAYSVYPSNVSAKLPPKDPQAVADGLAAAVRDKLSETETANFGGVVIIDANDLGRNVLGHNTKLSVDQLSEIFDDNPLGQANERTPLGVVVDEGSK
ncbi:asparagine synthase (glutamine-hydrolyzing) [Candidatus Saccharibacteria bacterium]|nr:asparagine synthase (glutamine-hydrolyzing) [Candidatus Saccharibacteria bacterium]